MVKKKKESPKDKVVSQRMMAGAGIEIDWSASAYNWSDPRLTYGGTIEGPIIGDGHVPWSSPDYNWSDSRITYDGTIIGQYVNRNVINVLYSLNQPNNTIYAPQLIRSRSRHRGPRESEKINLEMYQFLFDVRKLYELVGFNTNTYYYVSDSIEYGSSLTTYFWSNFYPTQSYDASTYDADDYDGPIFTGPPSNELTSFNIPGSDEIIIHLNRLLTRVKALETSRLS